MGHSGGMCKGTSRVYHSAQIGARRKRRGLREEMPVLQATAAVLGEVLEKRLFPNTSNKGI
jgi:hypothetical protein